ncbi:hypothetical protein ACFL6M_00505 [Candidatus Eisenbacteria bacterium]|uniref:Sulfatase-modifying factor enzyme domain-containing protein n=1 Tax=Eiseniibacteriota bacterium TaxID=2212470 RepID=A0ABV6YI91_UNCEI
MRVLRGGCWYHIDHYLRCATRYYDFPSNSQFYIGLRVARTVVP